MRIPIRPHERVRPLVLRVPPPSGAGGPVSASITGLSPNTTYHFTIVAANGTGTSVGSDLDLRDRPNSAPTSGPIRTPGAHGVVQLVSVRSACRSKRLAHIDLNR